MIKARLDVTRDPIEPVPAEQASNKVEGPDILITRPERAAQHLGALLQKAGYQPLVEPMLAIMAEHHMPPSLSGTTGVIFSSPNAVALTPYGELPEGWRLWPCFCVGTRTAYVAEKYGWQNIIAGDGGGAHLAQLIASRRKLKAGNLLHIGGAHMTLEPDASLRAGGFSVVNWTVYRAHAVVDLSPACREAMSKSLRAVLFFSARTARTFVHLVKEAGLASCCARMIALCLSKPIAAAAAGLPWREIVTADAPNEEALVAVLRRSDGGGSGAGEADG